MDQSVEASESAASPTSLRVLIVDDEKNIRATLALCLEEMQCEVATAASASAALETLQRQPFDLAFVDLRLGEGSGLDLLPRLLAESPGLAIVVVTAYATVDTAVAAIKGGATDYLPKPFTPAQIRYVVEQVIDRRSLSRRVSDLEQQVREAGPETDLETSAPKMQAVLDMLARAAASDAAVLLRGESGTGKGVLARFLHTHSQRSAQRFVVVNCPTLSEDLLTSELFGHTKGAFTGAIRDQPGRVEEAEGGTLFLDEIGEIPPGLQAKLLRFLQDKQFERVGENRTRTADVRVVAATNRDLQADVQAGHFREDLLFRINVVEVEVPPLRERREDLLPLARRFLAFFARAAKRHPMELSKPAEAAILSYAWPGNVRELRNVMERTAILWPAPVVEPAALPERIVGPASAAPQLGGDYTLEAIEREHILRVLTRSATQEEAARILGIDASTLWRKRKKYEQ